MDRENGHVPEQATQPKEGREALPELRLVELRKSEKPINGESREAKKKIEAICPWNNYTIVMIEGSDDIRIFDEGARLIDSFKPPLNSKQISIRWSDSRISAKIKKRYIAIDGHNHPITDNCSVSQTPFELRNFAKLFLDEEKKRGNDYFQLSSKTTPEIFSASNIVIFDKYIVLTTKEGVYFAFVTQNEQGIVLPPRNWKRIEPADEIPPELNEYAEKVLQSDGYKPLNEKYSATVTDVGLNIVKNEKSESAPLFSDGLPSVGENVAVDPNNPNVIYYCQSSNPRSVLKLDLTGEPNTWQPVPAEFAKKYPEIRNLQLDPSGNFFLFYSGEDLVVMTKDGLEEVKKVSGLTQVNFDKQGKIHAVDKDGFLVILEPNFSDLVQELEQRRIADLAAGIDIGSIFDLKKARIVEEEKGTETFEYLQPLRAQFEEQINQVLATITTSEGVHQLRGSFNKIRDTLRSQKLKPNEIAFILEGLEAPIVVKEKEFAADSAAEALTAVRLQLASGLSIASVSEARATIEAVKAYEALLDVKTRQEVHEAARELAEKSLELFSRRGGEIIKDVRGLVERTKSDLEAFTGKSQMDDWLEFRFPQLKSRLGSLAHDCPLEADEAYKAIIAARNELQTIASRFEERFKQEYAKVREKAVERLEATIDTLETDIEGLIERLRSKGFADRRAAEQYLDSSEARKTLETEIAVLVGNNPEVAKELERALKVKISNTLTEIERGSLTKVAETGQQMIAFGKILFPKWEAKVKEKTERRVDVVFDEDEKTHGPGVKAGEILGDVAVNITTSSGKIENVRLYEGWKDENDWRLGLQSSRGQEIPPSYMSAVEYKTIKKEFSDWSLGERSKLRKELQEKKVTLEEVYSRRQGVGKRTPETDEAWKKEYQEKLKEYATFVAEHHIVLLKRIDRIKTQPEVEHSNGKGFVPEWQNHWVNDTQTEKDLEEMASAFKMQLDLQEGLLNLKGHAGTGKDVRIKMFCALTHRPYFGIDCTKWLTEFELSEDVILESVEGASQTIRVPSAVLNGITTPGAVVYFNEFNAMTEQAQIFLHALLDEKRSLTLKTSSGKVIRALPSVLLASSMNPGYPGTFEPQFATRSRIVSVEIGYPPLTRQPDKGDNNPNPVFDSSEALRIARGVDSLSDLTYEASLERNEFVKMWDKYVNGIENGAVEPNSTQKFDLDVTFALIQFANNLRENFIKIFEESSDAYNALPVTQPITGRELRRCAYALSQMSPEEKATANSDVVARSFLEKYFLTHIDKKEDRDKIRNAMNVWSPRKRVRA